MNTKVFYFALLVSFVFGSPKLQNGLKRKRAVEAKKNLIVDSALYSNKPKVVRKAKTAKSRTTSPSFGSSPASYSSGSVFDSTQSSQFEEGNAAFSIFDFGNSEDALINVEEEAPKVTGEPNVESPADDIFEVFTRNLASSESEKDIVSTIDWDIEIESKWCLGSVEFRQLYATTLFNSLSYLVDIPADRHSKAFDGIYAVDRNWPEMGPNAPVPSTLSQRFHTLALIAIVSDYPIGNLRKLFNNRLIDLERPIFIISTGVYKTFLSFTIDQGNPNMEKIELLLSHIPKHMINKSDSNGCLPLELAVVKNNLDLVKKLVEAGADPNILPNPTKYSPFMHAIDKNNTQIVEYLIDTGKIDFMISAQGGASVLFLAVCNLNSNLLQKVLIATVKSSNFDLKKIGAVMLHSFNHSRHNFYNFVKAIIQTREDKLVLALLFITKVFVINNNVEVVKHMKSLNVPMNYSLFCSRNLYHGYGFIHIAAARGHLNMFKLLLSYGISPFELTKDKKSVLVVAYTAKHYQIIEEILKLTGLHPELLECLEYAISVEDIQMIDVLLGSSLDLDKLDFNSGHNLITKAISMNKSFILERLIKSGKVNVHQPDRLGFTIHNISLPQEASDHLKALVQQEIEQISQIFDEFI